MEETASVNVTVKINNITEFSTLVEKFNEKARELEAISHELMRFQIQGEIESRALSDNANEIE
ncbi:hypothetical protein JZI52_11105 [Streptococcus equi subsp. equi]|uniref:hypothetical protein n=1 Tax=Streptococcus equi TaxID=1336 RepID=UPI001BDE0D86|nr:hypothetical protein [Streptococcus equi]MBT1242955.1 hypothetical protein [Streptococcus equi subsp. equi]